MNRTLACFGWSARAWAHPWKAFLAAHPGLHVGNALEVGAGPRSSLAPLLLPLAERVQCSAHDAAALAQIQAAHARALSPAELARLAYARQDVRALHGRWDLIVLKSVLGGVHRLGESSLAEVHRTLGSLVREHLRAGGWLVTLDNGRGALAPLLAGVGARRHGWRFFRREDFPPADEYHGYGVLSAASAATRLGTLGRRVDDALYLADRALSPLVRQHAVQLRVYRAPA